MEDCTKRVLLQQRLPEPKDSQQVVQVELEGTPHAYRATPSCVAEWAEFGGQQLEAAIKQRMDAADNDEARCARREGCAVAVWLAWFRS